MDPRALVAGYRKARLTLAVAESLTAGLIAARIADVPGASAVLRGAVVAYATDLKATLLGVDPELLRSAGPVHPEVARQMAAGVRHRLSADVGVATTGVAGPRSQGASPVGTVVVAVVTGAGSEVREERLAGGRAAVREGTVLLALDLAARALAEHRGQAGS